MEAAIWFESLLLFYGGKHSAEGKEREQGWNEIIKDAWKQFFDSRAMNIQDGRFISDCGRVFLDFQPSSKTFSIGFSLAIKQDNKDRGTRCFSALQVF